MNRIRIYLVAGVICFFLLTGCGGQEATPTKAVLFEEPTVDVQATVDAAVQGTRAAEVTDIPGPTNTPAPKDASQPTDTSEPTDMPEPTNTPEATPTNTSAPASEGLHKQLTGTWTSDIMTVAFDWEAGTYSGVGLGERFERKLTLVSEDPSTNIVVFKSDESTIVCQMLDDGSILLRKQIEGGIPVILTRASSDVTVPSATEEPESETAAEIIQSQAFMDTYNTFHIVGVIENAGNAPMSFIKVVATVTDAEGNFIDADFSYTEQDVVFPGQKTPFGLSFLEIPTNELRYDLALEGDTADAWDLANIYPHLEIGDTIAKWDYNIYEIAGVVTNTGDEAAEFVKIIATIYDTNGYVMAVDFSYTTLDVVPAGGSSPFEILISDDAMAALDKDGNETEIGRYELIVEGEPLD